MRNLLVLLLFLCGPLSGQVVQYGKVMEWDGQGGPLVGVTLTVPSEHDCQPTISDSKGNFRLCFNEHSVGSVVHEIMARKPGYDVVNVHVTRSWTLTTEDTLTIIMAPKGKLKEARTQYYGLSRLMELNQLWMREGGAYHRSGVAYLQFPYWTFRRRRGGIGCGCRYSHDQDGERQDVCCHYRQRILPTGTGCAVCHSRR